MPRDDYFGDDKNWDYLFELLEKILANLEVIIERRNKGE